MAKQTGLIKFTGKLDNVIGYCRNGVHFMRSMPHKVRQTPATRQAAKRFGAASRKGKLIRRAFTPYLDLPGQDGSLVNRLNKALIQADNTGLKSLKGFGFNRHACIDKLFMKQPAIMADGMLQIPAQQLLRPPGATHLEMRVIAARINFNERRVVAVAEDAELIDLHSDFQGIKLNASVHGKGTLLIMLQVQPCMERHGRIYPRNDRRYMAADIISIIAAQQPATKKRRPFRPVSNSALPVMNCVLPAVNMPFLE